MAWGMNRDEVQTCFVLSPARKMILSAVLPFFPINLVSCVKTLFPFQPFSNCLCCVSLTLRCPLISSLRQDLSFSPLLTSFFKMQPHLTRFSPFLLFPPRVLFFPRCSPYFFCAIASALSENAELFSALTVNLASLLWTPEFRNSAHQNPPSGRSHTLSSSLIFSMQWRMLSMRQIQFSYTVTFE